MKRKNFLKLSRTGKMVNFRQSERSHSRITRPNLFRISLLESFLSLTILAMPPSIFSSLISLPADEINSLRREAQEMSVIRSTLTNPGAAKRVFDKVFKADTERLLGMEDMWKTRQRPTPLDHDAAKLEKEEDQAKRAESDASVSGATLKDQRVWTLKDCVDVFDKR